MVDNIVQKTCVPCKGGIPPLTREEASRYMPQTPGWEMSAEGQQISRSFKLANFRDTLAFVEKVGALVEEERHHPEICFGWGHATVTLQTRKIRGLHENDFIMAAKINRIFGA